MLRNPLEQGRESLDPLDSRLMRAIKNNQRDITNRGFTNQPVIGDPYDLVVSNYARVSATVVQTTASEINRWQKGDRILIRQASTDKTFIVTGVNSGTYQLTITAGTTYTFTTSTIERVQIAPIRVIPPGYPASYQFNPNLAVSTGSISNITYTRRDFSVLGDLCTAWVSATFDVGGGGSQDILFTLPVPGYNLGDTQSTFLGSFVARAATGTPSFAYASSLSGSDYTQCSIEVMYDYFDGTSQGVSGKIEYKIV